MLEFELTQQTGSVEVKLSTLNKVNAFWSTVRNYSAQVDEIRVEETRKREGEGD